MPQLARLGNEDALTTLCRMALATQLKSLSKDVVEIAKDLVLDVVAITIVGSSQEGIAEVVNLVKESGGKAEDGRGAGQVRLWARGPRQCGREHPRTVDADMGAGRNIVCWHLLERRASLLRPGVDAPERWRR